LGFLIDFLMSNTTNKKQAESYIPKFLLLSLTLGLAPWSPPHIIGKVEWLLGGAVGMQPMDWFDLIMHGTPWVLLFGAIIREGKKKFFPN